MTSHAHISADQPEYQQQQMQEHQSQKQHQLQQQQQQQCHSIPASNPASIDSIPPTPSPSPTLAHNHTLPKTLEAALSTAAALAAVGATPVVTPALKPELSPNPAPANAVPLQVKSTTLAQPSTSQPSAPQPSLQPVLPIRESTQVVPLHHHFTYTTSSMQQPYQTQLQPMVLPSHQQQPQQHPSTIAFSTSLTAAAPGVAASGLFNFQTMKLRRGKWTPEEEAYADVLIKEFERGAIVGCENGCTLRSFLSRKLHCAPMRISKKFAGKSIGKHVFLSRSTVSGIGKTVDDTTDMTEKLKDLEDKFYRSLFREADASNRLVSFVPQHLGYPIVGATPTPYPLSAQPNPSPVTFASFQQPLTTVAPSWNTGNSSMTAQPPCSNSDQQANQLHETFLSALNAQPFTQHLSGAPNTVAPAAPASSSPTLPVRVSVAPSPSVPTPPQSQVTTLEQQQQPPAIVTTQQTEQQEHKNSQLVQFGVPSRVHEIPAPSAPTTSDRDRSYSMDIPDFLSGFDKVKSCSNNNGTTTHQVTSVAVGNSEYSPPFTSRSFDDCHKLLGEGLSPGQFDLNESNNSSSGVQYLSRDEMAASSRGKPHHESVSADWYSIFAQQSVLAVSQHSAYSRQSPTPNNGMMPLPDLTLARVVPNKLSNNNTTTSNMTNTPIVISNPGLHTSSVVTAANLRTHSMTNVSQPSANADDSMANVISGSEQNSSEWGASTDESGSTGLSSDNLSHGDSDSNSDDGPRRKRIKVT